MEDPTRFCPCGIGCRAHLGHVEGTQETSPLAALIAAFEELLATLVAAEKEALDHEQEPKYGQRSLAIRRLDARLSFAKQKGTCYSVKCPGGRRTVVASPEAFERVACAVLALCLSRVVIRDGSVQAFQDISLFTDEICQIVDLVVPEPEDTVAWLAFATWYPALFAAAPDYYDVSNGLEPTRILYENGYQYVRHLFEDQWVEIVEQAGRLAQQDERQALDLLLDRLRQNMAFPSDDYGVLTRLITAEQKRLEGMTCLRGSGR